MGEEEEAAARACTLPGLEHHPSVQDEAQGLVDHILIDFVEHNNFLKLLLFVTRNLRFHF